MVTYSRKSVGRFAGLARAVSANLAASIKLCPPDEASRRA